MIPHFELKEYQQDVLDILRAYFLDVATRGDHRACFQTRTGLPYVAPPAIDHAPFICLRVPTGGGKTILAAHAIPIAAQTIMRTDCPVVIWFTPSTTIRDQTLKSLRDRHHPNRRALMAHFGENLRVMDIDEALHAHRPDYDGGLVLIVATIQSFRTEDKDGRKVYEPDNGALMDHFSGLPAEVLDALERAPSGEHAVSLANVFRLRRPLIIADEAHNMSTQLSFDTLARLNPLAIVEFTATPTKHEEADEKRGKYASNILHHVSAAELKAADMIKMPVILRGRPDPKETIEDAMGQLRQLQDLARQEEAATREFIRPLMLLQAEAESKDRETIHADILKAMLIDQFRIPEGEIAISTGKKDELDGVDLFARDCKIRFIITQQKLREGWDCSFAYVLCSVAAQKSERSVEQLLGRILRLPRARRKMQEELNTAFAFATTSSFQETAKTIEKGLVSNGFEPAEAEFLLRAPQLAGFEEGGASYRFEESIPLSLDPAPMKAQIEALTMGRVTIDVGARKIMTRGALSPSDRRHLSMAWPDASSVIDRLHHRSWGWLRAEPEPRERRRFQAPALAVRTQLGLEFFDKEHFLDHPWPLEACDPSPILGLFTDVPAAQGARLDIDASGQVRTYHEDVAQGGLFGRGAEWSKAALVNWLDRQLLNRPEITHISSRLFIGAALDVLMDKRGLTLNELGRARFRLSSLLSRLIDDHRSARREQAWNAVLFAQSGLDLTTHSDLGFLFDSDFEHQYVFRERYNGSVQFRKHVFAAVGDLADRGEEYDCAVYIDNHPRVRAWVRNTHYNPGAFWLRTSSDKFYPDFLVQLTDDRIMAVEYKGGDRSTNDDTEEKQLLGELWADRSGGVCLFCVPVKRDFAAIDRAMAA